MNQEQNKELNQLCHIKERAKADAALYGLWANRSQKRYEKVNKEIQELKASIASDNLRINSPEETKNES